MEPYIGELRMFVRDRIPNGWAICDGTFLDPERSANLFAQIGYKYGQQGKLYGLPDLRGRVPLCVPDMGQRGSTGGSNGSRLVYDNMPTHTHLIQATSADADKANIVGNLLAKNQDAQFVSSAGTTFIAMSTNAVGKTGTSAPISNMQPSVGLVYCIAAAGITPPRG